MTDETSPAFFTKLAAEYTPELVTFRIEIMPAGDVSFDVPPNEIVAELGPCLKYILARFSGACSNGTGPSGGKKGGTVPTKKTDRQQARMAKTLNGGQDRAMQVLEKDLALAKEDGDPKAIERATQAVKAGQAHKDSLKNE